MKHPKRVFGDNHLEEELDSIEKNETWEMVTPPPGCKPIGLKWVYKIKRNSQKQKIVALSSCQAEYVAATTATCQGIWLARLIGELMNKEMISMTLMVDNKSAIALSKNPVFHNRSKHIETKFHYIRTCLEEKKMELDFISSENQLADLFTKSLGRLKFEELHQRLSIRIV